jgi:hypothetical protein
MPSTSHDFAIPPIATRTAGIAAVYGVLTIVMVWSRFAGIGESLWHDEIYTVQHFIVPGPPGFFGRYNPNDHILFSVLAWLTVQLPGLGDSAYRLWSVLPFIAAVGATTAWLHRRAGTWVATLFALLSTTSSQLLILSTEARGYGLAFFAMAIMTIAAYEAHTRAGSAALTSFAAAGIIGCWTLPTFALPLVGVSAVLLTQPSIRRRLILRLAVAFAAIGCWYAIPASALIDSRGQQFGVQLPWHAPLTGAATELAAAFVPSIDASAMFPMLIMLPILVAGVRAARTAMPGLVALTGAPITCTFLVLTLARFYVEERFVSYLLVPILILAAFGLKRLLTDTRPPHFFISATYSLLLVSTAVLAFALFSARHARLPQEADREAASTVAIALKNVPRPVVLNTLHPNDVLFYLKGVHPFQVGGGNLEGEICSPATRKTGVIFVQQPFGIRPVDTSCLARHGASMHVWHQWDRGQRITVWVAPPAV